MQYHFRYCLLLVFILLGIYRSKAQLCADSLCGTAACICSADRSPAGIMISHVHEKKQWMLSYRYMNMYMNELQSGTTSIARSKVYQYYQAAPIDMQMNMHMLMGMYGFNDKFSLMGMLNYTVWDMNMDMASATSSVHNHSDTGPHKMHSSGIGDAGIQALYEAITYNNHHLILNGGLNLPLGNTEVKGAVKDLMYSNTVYPYAMQQGSGTTDMQAGVNYLWQKGRGSFGSQFNALIRTGKNNAGYSPGNELNLNNWLAWQWLKPLSSSVRINLLHSEKIKGSNPSLPLYDEPSGNPSNYGGNKIMCYAGLVFQSKNKALNHYRLAVEYGLPAYENLNGIQLKTQQALSCSCSVLF